MADLVPATIPAAMQALDRMLVDLRRAQTYEEIEKLLSMADAIKIIFKKVDDVRLQAGKVIVLGCHRIGSELLGVPPDKGGRPTKTGNTKLPVKSATLAELAGYKMRGHRLKKLAHYDEKDTEAICDGLIERRADNITVGVVLKTFAGLETEARRAESRSAAPLPDGVELRIGDCREVLADIPDNSVPLILTDPPYGDEAEPLYQWLAEFSARVLIPGGSLICYTGQSRLNRDIRIFDEKLRYWWLLIMPHQQSQRLPGKFVIANFKPVLWYVKGFRRGRTLMPDVLKSPARDKSLHNWAQGEGGLSQIVEHLSEPDELIVDPFAGSAKWGNICADMGRRWLGSDVVKGGATEVIVAAAE